MSNLCRIFVQIENNRKLQSELIANEQTRLVSFLVESKKHELKWTIGWSEWFQDSANELAKRKNEVVELNDQIVKNESLIIKLKNDIQNGKREIEVNQCDELMEFISANYGIN